MSLLSPGMNSMDPDLKAGGIVLDTRSSVTSMDWDKIVSQDLAPKAKGGKGGL